MSVRTRTNGTKTKDQVQVDAAILKDTPNGITGEIPENIEELAAQKRLERQEKCGMAINKVLEEYNCVLSIFLKFGETPIPIQHVVAVPAVIIPTSR